VREKRARQFQQKWAPVLRPELREGKAREPIPAKVASGFASGIAAGKAREPIPAKAASGFASGIAANIAIQSRSNTYQDWEQNKCVSP